MDIMTELQREVFARTGVNLPAGNVVELSLGPTSHVNRPLTNVAVQYQNRDMIADLVMPPIQVAHKSDNYFVFRPETNFSLAKSDFTSNEAMPGRVSYGLTSPATYTCTSRGLMDFVSVEEQSNADSPLNPKVTATEVVRSFLDLGREYRVAAVVNDTANYGTNYTALSGAQMWDQSTSDPVKAILDALRKPLVRPNTMVIGEEAFDCLRQNKALVQYIISRAQTKQGATPILMDEQTIADAFRLDKVLIGKAIYNSAVEGQTASFTRVWGRNCALLRIEQRPDMRRTQTFGYTFRFRPFETRSVFAELPGLAGGTYIKVSHSDSESVVGGQYAGYLFTNVCTAA